MFQTTNQMVYPLKIKPLNLGQKYIVDTSNIPQ